MKQPIDDRPADQETLQHLMQVVQDNREQRCTEIIDKARAQAKAVTEQAWSRSRARLHRHVTALREKYRVRLLSAEARNQTLMRQQGLKDNQQMLDTAWPGLRQAMLTLWDQTDTRMAWMNAALEQASASLLRHGWQVEHAANLTADEHNLLREKLARIASDDQKMTASDQIEAGIRISAHGTVLDATVDGLLRRRASIEAQLISRLKQEMDADD